MLPGKTYTVDEVLRVLRDRWWIILLPLVVGTLAGIVAFRAVPVKYRSETLITVIRQRIPDSYVKSTVTAPVEDRLSSISDQIMSRSRLERIIVDFDLYGRERANGVMEDVVQRMRADISVKLESRDLFRVSYISSDPGTAQKVTARLASLFIEENLRDREDLAEGTSVFLDSQLVEAKRQLIEQERRLEAYRRSHAGQLPSQLPGNLQSMQNAQMQLQAVGEAMNRARERRLLIERQIADAQSLPAIIGPQGAPNEVLALPAAQQLEAARARLEGLERRYTPDHPDVRSLKRLITRLEAEVEEDARHPKAVPPSRVRPEDLLRQKRIRDLEADMEVIDRQIAAGQADEASLRRIIADLQGKIDVVPTRESELVELTRDYRTLQEAYSSLLTKREDSRLAANLERRQIGEQFRVLDAAALPERPHNEKQRMGVLAGGVLGGLVLGLALVAFLEYRDSSFKSEEEVLRVLSLPVLALVPVIGAPEPARGSRWRRVKTRS